MKDMQNFTNELLGDRISVKSWIHDLRGLNSFIKLTGACGSSGVKNKSAIDHLVKKLNDTDPDVRVAAAKALGWKKDKRAVEPLIKKLKDNDDKVRHAAIKALGEIGDERAAPPLALLCEKMYPQDETWKTVLDSLTMIYLKTYSENQDQDFKNQ